MLERNIPIAEVVSVMGVSVNRAQEPLLKMVIRLSACISCLMLAYLIGSIVSYARQEEPVTINDWITLFIFFALCGVSVPITGYYGAKEKDGNKLQMFTLGEGCVSCCSFTQIFTAFWTVGTVVDFCNSEACKKQFTNGTSSCIQFSSDGRGTRHISRDLCDNPYSYWYLWYIVVFLGPIAVVSGIATCKAIELRNKLHLMVSPRGGNVRTNHVATSQGRVINPPLNRNVPDLPPHTYYSQQQPGAMVVQPGSIQMVPMVTEPIRVVQNQGETKFNRPQVLVPVKSVGNVAESGT